MAGLTLWDKLLLLMSAIMIGAGFYFVPIFLAGRNGAGVEVKVGNQPTSRFSLERKATFAASPGGCVVEIDRGRARVSRSNCPKQLCVKQGWIEAGGPPIICLPHRTVIAVGAGGASLPVDVTVK